MNTTTMYIIITGTSSGLGKALAVKLLEKNHRVLGISRRQTIYAANYEHLSVDLSDETAVAKLSFNISKENTHVLLINNAGQIEPIDKTAELQPDALAKHYQVNVWAVHTLCAMFLRQTHAHQTRHIINISSGAGKYPVPGWSAYCAGKAAVDALSKVIAKEYNDVRIWSLAPGIVDTPMQQTIRNTPKTQFPEQKRFIDYYKNGELNHPDDTAEALIKLLNTPNNVNDVVISLRDYM